MRPLSLIIAGSLTALLSGSVLAQAIARGPVSPDGSAPAPSSQFLPDATLTEGFTTVAAVPPAGSTCTLTIPASLGSNWFARNNSVPAGTTCWFQGNAGVFPAQAGDPTSYAGSNFNATTGANTLSTWLVTPRVQFGAGAVLEFWVRKGAVATDFPDRLQVRASTAADTGTPNVGTAALDVGTFTTLVLDINPTLTAGDQACVGGITNPADGVINRFPRDWCRVRITTGLPAGGIGRLAFRYFVTSGGPAGANSDFIGVDTFSFVEGSSTPPSLSLSKRVQLSTGSTNTCAPSGTSVTLPFGGGAVDYCYTATNTGGTPLITHTLVDPAFSAPGLDNFAFNLTQAASVTVRATKTVTATEATGATWTACNQVTNCVGAAVAVATVPPGRIVAGVAEVAANAFSTWSLGLMLLAIGSIGMLAFRRQA